MGIGRKLDADVVVEVETVFFGGKPHGFGDAGGERLADAGASFGLGKWGHGRGYHYGGGFGGGSFFGSGGFFGGGGFGSRRSGLFGLGQGGRGGEQGQREQNIFHVR